MIVTTSTHLEGYKITKHLGIVRGITVRSRGIGGNFIGGLQTLFGGKISIYANLCERARQEAYDLIIQNAEELGAMPLLICDMMPTKLWRVLQKYWHTVLP